MSSGARELIVIESSVENVKPEQMSGHSLVYWLTDSKCLVAWLERGSKIAVISERIVALFRKLQKMKLVLVWIPRSDYLITLADAASKFKDTDDWGLNEKSFRLLEDLSPVKFTLDAMANCTNKKCRKFYSKVASPGSSGVNCFMFDWKDEYVYCCPPVKLVTDVICHMKTVPCKGLLVIPNWKTDKFWPFITFDGAHLSSVFTKFRRFKPTIKTGRWCSPQSYFELNSKPEMLALSFDTTRNVTENEIISPGRCLLDDCLKCKHRFVSKLNMDGLVDDSDNEEEENEVCQDVTEASGSDMFRKVDQDDCRSVPKEVDYDDCRGVPMEVGEDVNHTMKGHIMVNRLEPDSVQYDVNK